MALLLQRNLTAEVRELQANMLKLAAELEAFCKAKTKLVRLIFS